jgi:hypothetical protein
MQFWQNLNRISGGARMRIVQWLARIIILLQEPFTYEQSLSHSYVLKLRAEGRRFNAILCVGVVKQAGTHFTTSISVCSISMSITYVPDCTKSNYLFKDVLFPDFRKSTAVWKVPTCFARLSFW